MKWVALWSLVAAAVLQQPAPLLRTRGGLLRGRLARDGRLVEYLGIPYGTVNEHNRFKELLVPAHVPLGDMKRAALWSLVAAAVLQQPAPLLRTRGGLLRGRLARDGRLVEYLGIPYGTVNEHNRFKELLVPAHVPLGDMKRAALWSLVAAAVLQQPAPLLRTRGGLLRGRLARDGRLVEYLGIPYGTVNEHNRFKAPLPPPKWNGVFEAFNTNTRCPQTLMGSMVIGSPDCLKLNVYTPTRNRGKLLPVMVYIHGGCFFEGTGSAFLYGADYFVEHGVVFVGINYRLNVEGFLCLGTEDAPGNAGLKDQVAALKWIRDNIKAFGGNPDSVTLFGESAGAVSSSFLVLSQAAKGLFHRVILQSGSTLAPWALQHDPIRTASALVKQFGYDTKDPYEIYDILSNKTVYELIKAKATDNQNYITSDTLFVPCIEKNLPGIEPIITKYPASIIESGNYTKIPMIIGFNDNEGIYFVAKDYGTSLKSIDPKENLQPDLVFPSELDKNSTVDMIRNHYFPPEKDELILNMVDLYSDLHFKFPSVLESDLYARTSDKPIYFYLFKYGGYRNMAKIISRFGTTGGASHADELFYMFKPHSIPFPHQLERRMIKLMVTLWTNFAKYSDPTPTTSPLLPFRWQPGRASNPSALVIDGQLSTSRLWDHTTVGLWNDTYTKYRRKRYGFH